MLVDNEKTEWRLQHYMALCGVASRRNSENIILEGRVSVNGQIVDKLGIKVSTNDIVCVDGKQIEFENEKRYVLLNKPVGYVCSLSDEKGRPIAADLLKNSYSERLYNVGRLDMFSSGLLLFTNDGNFAAKLSHPSAELEKEYIVDTAQPLPRGLDKEFMKGLRVDGVFYKCKEAEELNARRMRIVLIEGKNREIRRVFDYKRVGIRKLKRIRIGCIGMGNLEEGEFRDLSKEEIQSLLRLCTHNE